MPAAAAAAICLVGCGSSGTKTVTVTNSGPAPATSTASTATATTTPAVQSVTTTTASSATRTIAPAPPKTVHLSTFRSPSGNIGCIIFGGGARCDIRTRSWSPPPHPASCPPVVDYGQGLAVDPTGRGRFVCAGDTALDPQAAPLPYGENTTVGSITCSSASNGMTCTETRARHGFFIAVQGYRIF